MPEVLLRPGIRDAVAIAISERALVETENEAHAGVALQLDLLRDYFKEFSNMTLAQRMSLYKLREDRADVIVPALLIYINVMRWADAEEIFVPKIGLADGLIHTLYEEVKMKEIEV